MASSIASDSRAMPFSICFCDSAAYPSMMARPLSAVCRPTCTRLEAKQ